MAKTSHEVVTVAVVAIISILGIVMFMGDHTVTAELRSESASGGSGFNYRSIPVGCSDTNRYDPLTPDEGDYCQADSTILIENYCDGGRIISFSIDCANKYHTSCISLPNGQGYCG